jgi:hypothetical protein
MTLAAALLRTWMAPHLTQAKTFHCGAADTQCLIASITEANTNGQKTNSIRLEAGTYTLTAVNNTIDRPNGLPSATSTLTITGEGADITILKAPFSVPFFRLLQVAASGTLTLEGLTLRNGITTAGSGDGSGIRNHGTLTVTNCSLEDNQGKQGGGIRNHGVLTRTNSTLTNNRSSPNGGGILISDGTVFLQNIILARNTILGTGQDSDCAGPITSLGNNLIGTPSDCTITLQPTDLRGNPGLDAYTDDGTPGNGYFPLLLTSQAIDAGNDAACPKIDQLGEPRHKPCDIGAIEFQEKIVSSR